MNFQLASLMLKNRLYHKNKSNPEPKVVGPGSSDNQGQTVKSDPLPNSNPFEIIKKKPYITKMELKRQMLNAELNDISRKGPTFYAGWVQYFKFTKDVDKRDKQEFYKNNLYLDQMRLDPYADKTNPAKIPSQTSYWATLFENQLIFSPSRVNRKEMISDVLQISYVLPIKEGAANIGGVRDLGNLFEGGCIMTETAEKEITNFKEFADAKNPKITRWIVCPILNVSKLDRLKEECF